MIETYKPEVEKRLFSHVESKAMPHALQEAMLYSLKAGGKRVRPLLTMAAADAYGRWTEEALDVACAVEMVHTYSLIHDDLPAMDDDDLRRGQPTNHKKFGEAHAILAGDALLTKSFQVLSQAGGPAAAAWKTEVTALLAQAAGAEGMVGGQIADIEGENRSLSLEELEYIHHHKTGELLAFAVQGGAIAAGAPAQDVQHLRAFSKEIGLVFQIKDDILDVEGDADVIGKPVGSDDGLNKSTYPGLLGLEGAKEKMNYHYDRALTELAGTSVDHDGLKTIASYIVERDR
ncbi:polyprenyl synthetase family protein [Salsuginibacillus halophilus]